MGSIFIHFLTHHLEEMQLNTDREDLMTVLQRVTRSVAVDFKSCVPMMADLDQNKQIPVILSTLMRKVYFCEKSLQTSDL